LGPQIDFSTQKIDVLAPTLKLGSKIKYALQGSKIYRRPFKKLGNQCNFRLLFFRHSPSLNLLFRRKKSNLCFIGTPYFNFLENINHNCYQKNGTFASPEILEKPKDDARNFDNCDFL